MSFHFLCHFSYLPRPVSSLPCALCSGDTWNTDFGRGQGAGGRVITQEPSLWGRLLLLTAHWLDGALCYFNCLKTTACQNRNHHSGFCFLLNIRVHRFSIMDGSRPPTYLLYLSKYVWLQALLHLYHHPNTDNVPFHERAQLVWMGMNLACMDISLDQVSWGKIRKVYQPLPKEKKNDSIEIFHFIKWNVEML